MNEFIYVWNQLDVHIKIEKSLQMTLSGSRGQNGMLATELRKAVLIIVSL